MTIQQNGEIMIRIEQNGLQWHEFELLANNPEVTHGVFTRHGGSSQRELASLNLGKSVGDCQNLVRDNREKVKQALQLPSLFCGKQCHGTAFSAVSKNSHKTTPVCDGLITQSKDIGLMILQADCQAAIFYDPINRALANVHCGWRGSVQNIYREMVLYMQRHFFSKAEDLLVCISPSLGPNHAEFTNYKTELPESFWNFQISPQHFDFWQISKWQLTSAGVLKHHIQIAEIDTFENSYDYFSYRRSNQTGRQATICALSDQ